MIRRAASFLFGAVVHARNRAYDRGWLPIHRLPVPVISVGNIAVGGTGKTPFVDVLAKHLLDRGETVAVATRGYGRRSRGQIVVSDGNGTIVDAATGGDEPVMLARRDPRLVVIADADRVRAGSLAVKRFGATVILLDDGFQHRRCARDLDIVLLDASGRLSEDRLLPRGRQREPWSSLKRADVPVFTKLQRDNDRNRLENAMRVHTVEHPLFMTYTPVALRHAWTVDTVTDARHACVAFCGIAHPEGFMKTLEDITLDVRACIPFADHYHYAERDIKTLVNTAEKLGATAFVTTEKDVVRLDGLRSCFQDRHVFYPEMRLEFLGNDASLHARLQEILSR